MGRLGGLCCAACLLIAAAARATDAPAAVDPHIEGPTPTLLSEYHLFADPAGQVPNDRVLPFGLNNMLFGDYAVKHRFVWMPPGAAAIYNGREVFEFPVGTVLVKSFAFPKDARDPAQGERLVETRLLVRKTSGWAMLPYVWNDDATDARLAVAGARVPVTWIHTDGTQRSQRYIVPNMNQCKHCHIGSGIIKPIGPQARYLNYEYAYADGAENQLARWTKAEYLSGLDDPASAPVAPRWDDPATGTLDQRARTYLDINCAHCHNPTGPAYTSGLDLSFDQTTPMRYGIFKAPVAAGRGASIGRYDIVPGNPDTSILLYRLATTDPGVRMPTAGRNLVHDEGLALVREWIASMPPQAAGNAQ